MAYYNFVVITWGLLFSILFNFHTTDFTARHRQWATQVTSSNLSLNLSLLYNFDAMYTVYNNKKKREYRVSRNFSEALNLALLVRLLSSLKLCITNNTSCLEIR